MYMAREIDEQRFARCDVTHKLKAQHVKRHGFTGDRIFRPGHCLVAAINHRPDAMRIAERQHAVARNHRGHRIRALAAQMHRGDRLEDHLWRQRATAARSAFEFERQHVEQHFTVAVGIDMARVELEQIRLQLLAVSEIAVVHERDAEWRIHVERLRLMLAHRAAGRRVADMANAGVAEQIAHVAGAEHVARHALGLVLVEHRAIGGHDAGGVLPAMLQRHQAVVDQLVHRAVRNDADHTTHGSILAAAAAILKSVPATVGVAG